MRIEELDKSSKIAVYSRKSRDESNGEEDVLLNHRMRLTEFIERNGFTDVDWYEEVLSGSTIAGRPKFREMISMVEKFMYSAVLVVDFDRLSRGDTLERGIIERAFRDTKTLIVMTNGEILDYNNTSEALTAGVKGLLANFELTQSSIRMREGKKTVVKKGKPHSGTAPYGYKWDRNLREVVVDEEAYKIYRMMVKWYIEDEYPFNKIASKLNEMKVPAMRGKYWYLNVVRRILVSDFHLGYIYHGKIKTFVTDKVNDRGEIVRAQIPNPNKDEILMQKGIHTPIKTPEEHALIISRHLVEKNRYANKSTGEDEEPHRLKGLIKCPHCKKVITICKNGANKTPYARNCYRKSKDRTELCDKTKGVNEEVLFNEVLKQLLKYKDTLFTPLEEESNVVLSIEDEIELLNNSILKLRKTIDKKKQMFEADIISIEELKFEVSSRESEILDIEDKVNKLIQSSEYVKKHRNDIIKKVWTSEDVGEMLTNPDSFTFKEINSMLKKIISYITFERDDHNLKLDIYYR